MSWKTLPFALALTLGTLSCQDRTVVRSSAESLTSSSAFQVGIKTGEQIAATMSALTGVPRTRSNVRDALNNLRPQLPNSHDLASFQASHQIAITKLATEYCDALFETADLRAALLPGVNFGQNPPQAYAGATIQGTIVDRLIERFWGAGLERLPNPEEARGELLTLFGGLLAGAPNTTTGTRNIAKGMCTTVLAASPVTLL
jgi:hypothetical protein